MPVVVSEQLHCGVHRRAGTRGRPPSGDVEAFTSEDAINIGLRGRSVDIALSPPVVFGDRRFCAGIVGVHPALDQRNQMHRGTNPAFRGIRGVPELPRGSVAEQGHAVGDVLAELTRLWVEVDTEDIQCTLPGGSIVLLDLLEHPGQVVHAAMRRSIRKRSAVAVLAPVLLIRTAVEVTGPAPFFRSDDQCGRVGGFHLCPIGQDVVFDFFHRGTVRVNVPMGGVPDARLVVEDVVLQAVPIRSSPFRSQVADPAAFDIRAVGDVCVMRIVARDEAAVRMGPVSGVGHVGIGTLLRAILGDGKARQLGPARPKVCDPANGWDGQHRLRPAGL